MGWLTGTRRDYQDLNLVKPHLCGAFLYLDFWSDRSTTLRYSVRFYCYFRGYPGYVIAGQRYRTDAPYLVCAENSKYLVSRSTRALGMHTACL